MRLDITEELKEKFLEFFPNRGKALTLTYTFKDYETQLEKDFAAYLDEKDIDYISYLNIKWDFKGSFFIFHKRARRQIFTYIPHFYIPSKDLVIDIYQKERAKNKYKIATFLFGNLNERYNKNHLYLSKEVFELIKLDKMDQLDNNRKKEIE